MKFKEYMSLSESERGRLAALMSGGIPLGALLGGGLGALAGPEGIPVGAALGGYLGPKIGNLLLPHKGVLNGGSFQKKQMRRKMRKKMRAEAFDHSGYNFDAQRSQALLEALKLVIDELTNVRHHSTAKFVNKPITDLYMKTHFRGQNASMDPQQSLQHAQRAAQQALPLVQAAPPELASKLQSTLQQITNQMNTGATYIDGLVQSLESMFGRLHQHIKHEKDYEMRQQQILDDMDDDDPWANILR